MAISRKTWGAVGPTGQIEARRHKTELFFHHSAGPAPSSEAGERRWMRATEAQHRAKGWSAIGYNYVIFPSGRLYEGRGGERIPAAQGGHNTGTVAICFVGSYTSSLPPLKARLRFLAAGQNLKRAGYPLRRLRGHRDAFPTECPGARLYAKKRRYARLLGLRP